MPSVVKASAEEPPKASREMDTRLDRLTGNSEDSWPTQEAGAGRTPEGERGPLLGIIESNQINFVKGVLSYQKSGFLSRGVL